MKYSNDKASIIIPWKNNFLTVFSKSAYEIEDWLSKEVPILCIDLQASLLKECPAVCLLDDTWNAFWRLFDSSDISSIQGHRSDSNLTQLESSAIESFVVEPLPIPPHLWNITFITLRWAFLPGPRATMSSQWKKAWLNELGIHILPVPRPLLHNMIYQLRQPFENLLLHFLFRPN